MGISGRDQNDRGKQASHRVPNLARDCRSAEQYLFSSGSKYRRGEATPSADGEVPYAPFSPLIALSRRLACREHYPPGLMIRRYVMTSFELRQDRRAARLPAAGITKNGHSE
jgi:hypothetical protein